MTKDDLIRQADAICREVGDELDAIEKKGDKATRENDYESLAEAYESLADQGTTLVEDLRALEYEGEGSSAFDAYLATSQEQMEKVRTFTKALRDVDFESMTSYGAEIENLGGKAEGLALGFGLKDCAFSD